MIDFLKYIIGLLFVLLYSNSFCQLEDSLVKYYYHVNKAEMLIVDSSLSEAIVHYDSAYLFKKTAFWKRYLQ